MQERKVRMAVEEIASSVAVPRMQVETVETVQERRAHKMVEDIMSMAVQSMYEVLGIDVKAKGLPIMEGEHGLSSRRS